jgi:hypothetical protein
MLAVASWPSRAGSIIRSWNFELPFPPPIALHGGIPASYVQTFVVPPDDSLLDSVEVFVSPELTVGLSIGGQRFSLVARDVTRPGWVRFEPRIALASNTLSSFEIVSLSSTGTGSECCYVCLVPVRPLDPSEPLLRYGFPYPQGALISDVGGDPSTGEDLAFRLTFISGSSGDAVRR